MVSTIASRHKPARIYPSDANKLPVNNGYYYSHINYIPAAMIVEKTAGKSFSRLVHEVVIEPHGLTSTFYEPSKCPEPVIRRLSHGYFEHQGCAAYRPHCKETWNAPIIGRDMRDV